MKPGSKKWKKFMAKLYGIGAAVVILGALFKIQHWPGASEMLIVGLGTEAIIFFFSAFEPIHEEVDWSLVYPELATGEKLDHDTHAIQGGSITEQLDNMLEEAKIEPELLASLGEGMRNLSTQAGQLNDFADATVATNSYVETVNSASQTMSTLTDSYTQAAEAIAGIANANDAGTNAGEQLSIMSNNLLELNNVYEMQLNSTREKMNQTNEIFEGINDMMNTLNESVEDTRRYKEGMAELSRNLSSLNTVYGNMLSAMSASNS